MKFWNDEREALCAKLWKEGMSATMIAERLGTVSRNAVIGKVHRLGLSGRVSIHNGRTKASYLPPARRKTKAKSKQGSTSGTGAWVKTTNPEAAAKAREAARAIAAAHSGEPPADAMSLLKIVRGKLEVNPDLKERACRYIYGEPSATKPCFCAKPALPGMSWCEEHEKVCMTPPPPKTGRPMRLPGMSAPRTIKEDA